MCTTTIVLIVNRYTMDEYCCVQFVKITVMRYCLTYEGTQEMDKYVACTTCNAAYITRQIRKIRIGVNSTNIDWHYTPLLPWTRVPLFHLKQASNFFSTRSTSYPSPHCHLFDHWPADSSSDHTTSAIFLHIQGFNLAKVHVTNNLQNHKPNLISTNHWFTHQLRSYG